MLPGVTVRFFPDSSVYVMSRIALGVNEGMTIGRHQVQGSLSANGKERSNVASPSGMRLAALKAFRTAVVDDCASAQGNEKERATRAT